VLRTFGAAVGVLLVVMLMADLARRLAPAPSAQSARTAVAKR
jgi:hypothetical protein